MSSTHDNLHGGRSSPACLAVNGKTDTVYRTLNTSKPNCVHTAVGDTNASWEVDLGRNYTVTNITIYRRERFQRRMSGIHVEVDSQTCYTFPLVNVDYRTLNSLPEKIDVTCTPPLTGRVVRLQKRGQPLNFDYGAELINICEVQVWGCRDGLYGADCGEQCGQCAGSDTCSAVSGHCPNRCQPGWKGDNCKQGKT
ncbi:hypothetical protein V1264_019917 [Littorina saxatilis]|uniref:Fucolectin-related molecule n=1 Tax=Littorina saxatilis TaxID=31220 RepID=A0AAN9GAS9_9CAEN